MNKQNNKYSKLVSEKISQNSISSIMSSESIKSITPAMPSHIDWLHYLDANNSSDIYVSAICSPNAFWVQLLNQDSMRLEDLLTDMNNHYNNNNHTVESFVRILKFK